MTKEEEFQLIKRIQKGEHKLFEELVCEHQKQVYNLALRMAGNEFDALDISQEAFLRAYTAIGTFRGESRFSVWLYRLTSNIAIDFLRRDARRSAVSLTVLDEEGERELEIPDERFNPETELGKKELRAAIGSAFRALPEEFRLILSLREISGLSYEELGSVLEIEPGTVKSRLSRARKKLCVLLGGNLPDGYPSNGI